MKRTSLSLICLLAVLAGALSETSTIYKIEGDDLSLQCISPSIVKWFINNETVKNTNHTQIRQDIATSDTVTNILNVKEVNMSGKYECRKPDQSSTEVLEEFNIILVNISSDATPLENLNSSYIDLQCRVLSGDIQFYPITWKRDSNEIAENGTKHQIIPDDKGQTVLRVHNPVVEDVGAYMCQIQIKENNSTVEGEASITLKPSVEPIEKLRSRVEGEKATIECKIGGYPVPAIQWFKRPDEEGAQDAELVYDERITVTENSDKVPDAKLVITELTIKEDKAFYTCVATNDLGKANTTALLKVKDKNAAVWPFLGICAEVITLCCIIFIFEKRRNKRMEEEEEVDAVKQELMNGNSENDDSLRQRNVNNKS